jgi:HEAT repeat protein
LPEVIAGIEDDRTRPPVVNFAVSYWLNQRHIDARSIPVEYTKKPDRKDAAVLDRQYRFELVLRVGPHAPEELVAMVSCDGPAGAPGPTFSESRWIAVAAVHSLEAEAALPIYREWIASEDPGVVAAGLLGLSWLEDAAAAEAPALVPLLSSEDPQLRWRAAMALQRIGSACEESAEPLAALLADEEKAARLYAAGALGVCGDTRGLAPMLELLRDKEPEFAADAARTLRFYRPLPPEAVPALADALGSRHVNVRLYALYTLGAYGAAAEPALPAIRKRCKDRIASVARAAEEALAAIEGAR